MRLWIIRLILKLLSYLPLAAIRALGAIVGLIALKFSKRSSLRLRSNLLDTMICNEENIEKYARITAQNMGKTLLESLTIAWQRPKSVSTKLIVQMSNFALVESQIAEGKALIFLTPHMGNFEIAVKAVAAKIKHKQFNILYKPSRNKLLNQLMYKGRTEDNINPLPTTRKGVAALLRAIKNKQIVGILPDSVASTGDGTWVDFFNNKVFATTLAAKMILLENTSCFIVACYRVAGGFSIEYLPYVPKLCEPENIVQDIYHIIEKIVLKMPTQYYWSYNRFRVPSHAQVDKDDS